MDKTVLNVLKIGGGQCLELPFSREGRGAERWRGIVDSLDDSIGRLERVRGFSAGSPDGDRSLGRGARRVIPRSAWPLLFAAWEETPAVRQALAMGELRIDGDMSAPVVMALARHWVAANLTEASCKRGNFDGVFE